MTSHCADCRFWFDVGPWRILDCRRRAPIAPAVRDGYASATGMWPVVNREDSCGEFEAKHLPVKHPPVKPVPLFERSSRDPHGMGDGCQAWFDL